MTESTQEYSLSMSDLQDLADALTLFDGNTRSQSDKDLISRCHQHIQNALGSDIGDMYHTDDEVVTPDPLSEEAGSMFDYMTRPMK